MTFMIPTTPLMLLQESITFARFAISSDLVAAVAVAQRAIVSRSAVGLAAEGGTGCRVFCREEKRHTINMKSFAGRSVCAQACASGQAAFHITIFSSGK